MSKTIRKFRKNSYYEDDYGYSENDFNRRKKPVKKTKKMKYFDEYDSFENTDYDVKYKKQRY
jgi:hypothetical protein